MCGMKNTFETSLAHVLVHEGGFSNHPADPGGATNRGVTLAVFRRHYGASMGVDDLRAITDEQLDHIYKTGYWNACRCDELPAGIDYVVFDQAVNSGPGRAARWLQSSLGVGVDGRIGTKTIDAAVAADAAKVINDMCDRRLAFLEGLKTWPVFGKGWSRRVKGVRGFGLELCRNEAPMHTPVVDYEIVRLGSRGPWVEKLQAALGIEVDGKFGPTTKATLEQFQASEGLLVDGVAGRNTYRALGLLE
jgi:lysozyme family protein